MVRLTDYVTSGGCACKIGPHILERVLKAVTPVTNEHVLMMQGYIKFLINLPLYKHWIFLHLLSMTRRYSVKLQRLMH